MYFLTETDFQAPCGGSNRFAANKINRSPVGQQGRDSCVSFANSNKLNQANGEKAKFTYESATCKGAKFWGPKIESR